MNNVNMSQKDISNGKVQNTKIVNMNQDDITDWGAYVCKKNVNMSKETREEWVRIMWNGMKNMMSVTINVCTYHIPEDNIWIQNKIDFKSMYTQIVFFLLWMQDWYFVWMQDVLWMEQLIVTLAQSNTRFQMIAF